MTIQQANQYFAALPDGFADPAQLGALLPTSVQQVQFVGVAGTAGKTATAGLLGAILQAAKGLGLSYRHAWGLLREAESIFGTPLLEKHRGRGTTLTRFATTLLWAERRIAASGLRPSSQ